MLRKLATHSLIAMTLLIAIPSFADSDPSMHQVYIAAQAGKFHEAQAMMDKVLHDHPNSGKAHFVEAELLAKQGLLSQAEAELNTAERLAPHLPFAKPQAIQQLKNKIAGQQGARQTVQTSPHAKTDSGTSWIFLLIVGILAFFIIRFVWRMLTGSNRPSLSKGYPPSAPNGMGNMPMGGMGGGMMPNNGGGGGMGSGIMGGLATGAAMGAGMVAGQALAHHFLDGNESHSNNNHAQPNNDMGGSDFGIADSSSWDDNSGGSSSSEWD